MTPISPVTNPLGSANNDLRHDHYFSLIRGGHEHWNEWINAHPDAEVDFSGCEFGSEALGPLSFAHYQFPDNTRFINTVFPCDVTFKDARFGRNCSFEGATFDTSVVFDGARFQTNTSFSAVHFMGNASFVSARFGKHSDFTGAYFKANAQFQRTVFKDQANFNDVTFCSETSFDSVHYVRRSTFIRAQFLAFTDFTDARFSGVARFTHVLFKQPPSFRGVQGLEYCDIHDVDVRLGSRQSAWRRVLFGEWNNNEKMVPRLRMLRGIAELTHFRDGERDLFLLERQSELSCKWASLKQAGPPARLRNIRPLNRLSGLSKTIGKTLRLSAETVIMLLYRWSSNCGRSALLPAVWLMAMSPMFQWVYRYLYASMQGTAMSLLDAQTLKLLRDFALGSLIPFASTTRPSYQAAVERLFMNEGILNVPSSFQYLAMTQGIIDLVLIFLIGVALRNYFHMR